MRRTAWLAVLLLAVLALSAAGCGGDDEPEAAGVDAWADGFCTSVSTWRNELQQIGDSISDPSLLSVDALKEAGEDASAATDAFVEDVRDLGEPDTESGAEIDSSVETLTDTLETQKDDLSEAVEGVEDLTDLPSAISAIGSALTAMANAFQTTLDAIRSENVGDEVHTAFESSAACDDLGS